MTISIFQERQDKFVKAIRAQEQTELDFISQEKMGFYQELILGTNTEILQSAFPVLYQILGNKRWQEIVRDYLKHYQNPTTIFHDIPMYFVEYLRSTKILSSDLVELAHYEWLELFVNLYDCDHDFHQLSFQTIKQITNKKIIINQSLVLMEYSYPVNEMSPSHYPLVPSSTYVAVYRDRKLDVKFTILSLESARFLYVLQKNDSYTVKEIIQQIKDELGLDDLSIITIEHMILDWVKEDIIENVT